MLKAERSCKQVESQTTSAKEISAEAATVVLSELGGVFTLKAEHRKALTAFLSGQRVSRFTPDLLWQVLRKHRSYIAASLGDAQLMSPLPIRKP